MRVSIARIIHHRGSLMTDCPEMTAYDALFQGNEEQARRILTDSFTRQYWSGVRNRTTHSYVTRVYAARREPCPGWQQCNPDYLREAIERRISDHIDLARDIEQHGCRVPPKGRHEGDLIRLNDGHNRTWILIATGRKLIDITTK